MQVQDLWDVAMHLVHTAGVVICPSTSHLRLLQTSSPIEGESRVLDRIFLVIRPVCFAYYCQLEPVWLMMDADNKSLLVKRPEKVLNGLTSGRITQHPALNLLP